jgi:hypothetical protein
LPVHDRVAGPVGLAAVLSCTGLPVPAEPRPPDLATRSGLIALSNWPQCDFLILLAGTEFSGSNYSLATWKSGMWFWEEGDPFYGAVRAPGMQVILVAGTVMTGEMTIEVEEVGVTLSRAQSAYYHRCKIP